MNTEILDFEFSLPTQIVFGKKAQEKIPELINKAGSKKVLIVSYSAESVSRKPIYAQVKQILDAAGIEYVELLGVKPNPILGFINTGIELGRKEKTDFVLAIGGGSVIDTAKGIALGINTSIEDVWAFASGTKVPDPANTVKVGVVLTAAAAGSETSTAAVISDEKTGLKRGAHHPANRPYFAILNPEVTYTVPKFQTACGVWDTMMHAFERYFTATENTPIADRITEGVVSAVIDAGYEVMKNLHSYNARATLMWGASVAHNNLNGCGRLKGSGIHLIEEEMHASNPNIIHGAGLSVIFPAWARKVYVKKPERFAQFANRVWGVWMDFEHPEKTALRGIECMESYVRFLGLPTTLREIGVTRDMFPSIVERCTANGRRVSQLCDLTAQDVLDILESCEG